MSSEISSITIGRFSQMTRLTQKALRLYDEKGILVPAIKDPMTGYRYYTVGQIEAGLKIQFLAAMGFSLKEISDIMGAAGRGDDALINKHFSRRLNEVQQDIQRLEKVESILLGRTSVEGLFMRTTDPEVKELSAMRVVSKRECGKIGDTIGKLIGEIFGQIFNPRNQGQVTVSGPPMYICHDDSYKEDNMDIEMAVPITGRITVDPEFEIKNLEGGKVIMAIYTGGYSGIGEAYTKVFEYMTKHGYAQRGPTREVYLTDPNEKPEDELMTELQLPIE